MSPGTPVRIVSFGAIVGCHGTLPGIYARVERQDGGTVYAKTPGGSTIRAGLLYVKPLATIEEFAALAAHDADAVPIHAMAHAADAHEDGFTR